MAPGQALFDVGSAMAQALVFAEHHWTNLVISLAHSMHFDFILDIWLWLAWNNSKIDQASLELRSAFLCLSSAGINGMCHHALPTTVFFEAGSLVEPGLSNQQDFWICQLGACSSGRPVSACTGAGIPVWELVFVQ